MGIDTSPSFRPLTVNLQLTAKGSGSKAKARVPVSVERAGARDDVPVEVTGMSTATQVSAGYEHTCATLANGHVACWGENFEGELGNGTKTPESAVPVEVTGTSTATQVSAGFAHTCALLANGHVECWGANLAGLFGDGKSASSDVPVETTGVSTAVQLSTGRAHTCAVLANGHVECSGYNLSGQLGNGTTTISEVPVEVTGIATATQVSAGYEHTCATLADGHIECWGSNEQGQLGNGTTTDSDVPVEVTGIETATQVSAGEDHTCAVLSTGRAKCWGGNQDGQLGDGTTTGPEICPGRGEPCSRTPVAVKGISVATGLSASQNDTCALLSDGRGAECWGANRQGQLGNRTTTADSDIPVGVSGAGGATQLAAGDAYACLVLFTGHAECWGYNRRAQLGNGGWHDDLVSFP
jgi:alpha-tubulin suppressor-like RCC1 family protein